MSEDHRKQGRGYIVVEMTINDPRRFKDYTALSAPSVHAAGGRYIVTGTQPEVLEGEFSAHRMVIVEFETAAHAREFYRSAGYQAARQKRLGAADFRMLLLEGASLPAEAETANQLSSLLCT
jgi:uncharacterized protein (DUF1330 family)